MPPTDIGDDAPTPDSSMRASCSLCGVTAAGPPVTWMREIDPRRGPVWVCAECARTHLRSIEAKLDQAWWN